MRKFLKFCVLTLGKVLTWVCDAIIPIVFDYIMRDDIISFITLIKNFFKM